MTKGAASRKRPKIGDVVRVATSTGVAFVQYTHRHPRFGELVRVIGPGDATDDPDEIAGRSTQFATFFPLGAACRGGVASIVGPGSIPKAFQAFPWFRQALRLDPCAPTPCNWRIWNGVEEQVVATLNDEQRRYPIREIISDALVVKRALSGWTADQEQ
jgi:hypothetical protein